MTLSIHVDVVEKGVLTRHVYGYEATRVSVDSQDDVSTNDGVSHCHVFVSHRLSGLSPMHADTSRETLLTVKAAAWQFDEKAFVNTSAEAKGFISKLLVKDPRYVLHSLRVPRTQVMVLVICIYNFAVVL